MSEGVLIKINGNAVGIKTAADDAKKAIKSIDSTADSSSRSTGASFKKIGAAAAAIAGAAAAGLGVLVSKSMESIDATSKLANQLGTTYNSMKALELAAGYAGVSQGQLTGAMKILNTNLSAATDSSTAQAKAFAKIGVSAAELQKIPVGQRIAQINTALEANVSASGRAAAAAEIYGQRNALVMQTLDAAAIGDAAQQMEVLGYNLSNIDAANVERANDSIDMMKNGALGLASNISATLAPAIVAIGERFFGAAKEAGGLGNMGKVIGEKILTAMKFVLNAVDGVGRAFTIVTSGANMVFSNLAAAIVNKFAGMLSSINSISSKIGLDFSPQIAAMTQYANGIKEVASKAGAEVNKALMTSLAGDAIAADIAKIKASADAAPKKQASETGEQAETASAPKGASKADAAQADAAAAAKIKADARAKELADEKAAYAASLLALQNKYKTESEVKLEQYTAEQELLTQQRATAVITAAEQAKLLQDVEAGKQAELNRIATEAQMQKEAADKQAADLEFNNRWQTADKTKAVMGELAQFMGTNSKRVFEISKKAAIAESTIAVARAVANALRGGTPKDWAMAALTAAKGLVQIQKIKSTQFGGGGGAAGGGGGGGSAGGGGGEAPQQEQQRVANVSIHANGEVMRALAKGLIEPLNDLGRDGYLIKGLQLA